MTRNRIGERGGCGEEQRAVNSYQLLVGGRLKDESGKWKWEDELRGLGSGEENTAWGETSRGGVLRRTSGVVSAVMFLHPQSLQGIVFDLQGMMQ